VARQRRRLPLGAGQLELLLAIYQGRVGRPDATMNAPYWLDRSEVRLQIHFLRGRELVLMPLSGPPQITRGRGEGAPGGWAAVVPSPGTEWRYR
jgi:hypothetical protein